MAGDSRERWRENGEKEGRGEKDTGRRKRRGRVIHDGVTKAVARSNQGTQ